MVIGVGKPVHSHFVASRKRIPEQGGNLLHEVDVEDHSPGIARDQHHVDRRVIIRVCLRNFWLLLLLMMMMSHYIRRRRRSAYVHCLCGTAEEVFDLNHGMILILAGFRTFLQKFLAKVPLPHTILYL